MEVKDIEKEVDIIIELTKDLKKNKGKKESEFSNMACFSFYMALFFSVFNLFFMDLNIFTFSLIIVLFFLTNFCLFINNVLMKINYSKDRKAIKEINPKYCDFRDLYLTNIFKKEYDKISKLSDLGLNILKKEFPNTHYQFKEKQIIEYLLKDYKNTKKSDFLTIKEQIEDVIKALYKGNLDIDSILLEIISNYIKKVKNQEFEDNIDELIKLIYNNVEKKHIKAKLRDKINNKVENLKENRKEMNKVLNITKEEIKNKIIEL